MSQQDQLNLLSCIFGPKLFDSWAFLSFWTFSKCECRALLHIWNLQKWLN